MRDSIRVLILGSGQMAREIVRVLQSKRGVAVVGVCDRRPDLDAAGIAGIMGLDADVDVQVESDLATAIQRVQPDIAIQATRSHLVEVWPDIRLLLSGGVSVISIAEEMAFPSCSSKAIARQMHDVALANGAVVLGTGVNPGFVMDLLVIVLSGVCAHVDSISATRANDLSPYGPSVLKAQGVGMTPDAFDRGLRDGSISGHIGFRQSMHMVAHALGWTIDTIEETREPIVSTVRRETPHVVVEPGCVAGCLHRAVAYRNGAQVITLTHPQQVHPALEGETTADRIEIRGVPNIQFEGCPEIPGGQATAALAVNVIPRVLSASPGLHTMADLPVPAALSADVRKFIQPGVVAPDG